MSSPADFLKRKSKFLTGNMKNDLSYLLSFTKCYLFISSSDVPLFFVGLKYEADGTATDENIFVSAKKILHEKVFTARKVTTAPSQVFLPPFHILLHAGTHNAHLLVFCDVTGRHNAYVL